MNAALEFAWLWLKCLIAFRALWTAGSLIVMNYRAKTLADPEFAGSFAMGNRRLLEMKGERVSAPAQWAMRWLLMFPFLTLVTCLQPIAWLVAAAIAAAIWFLR